MIYMIRSLALIGILMSVTNVLLLVIIAILLKRTED